MCVALNYHTPLQSVPEDERRDHGRVARYALGDDYHEIIKHRLARACSDSPELLEALTQAIHDLNGAPGVSTSEGSWTGSGNMPR